MAGHTALILTEGPAQGPIGTVTLGAVASLHQLMYLILAGPCLLPVTLIFMMLAL